MTRLLHCGRLLILTVVLACSGLAIGAAAQAATHPATAISAQPGLRYLPPDPC
ncbi:MAG TPA: hypothetical protein VIX15_02605 [Streptosporangiaceae bacterium]